MPEKFLETVARWSMHRSEWLLRGATGEGLVQHIRSVIEREHRPVLVLEYKRCTPTGFTRYYTPFDYIDAVIGSTDAWSVLVEPYWFCGSLELLPLFASTGLPVIARDFTTSSEQLDAYRHWGASAALLILAMLGWRRLSELYDYAQSIGLDALIETNGWRDAVEVMNSFPGALVGISTRDSYTLEEDFDKLLDDVRKAAARKPSEASLIVAEGGIDSLEKARLLAEAGADILVIDKWAIHQPSRVAELKALFKRQ